ncbi:hypothetical protein GCM10011428_16130 [Streptomyces violaceus]
MLRPFFFGAFEELAGGGETGSGSFGAACGTGPSPGAPGPNGEAAPDGTTGMPLVTVCPETLSWRGRSPGRPVRGPASAG